MNTTVPFQLFDVMHKQKPNFLSLTKKESVEGSVLISEGSFVENKSFKQTGLFLEAHIGDDNQGCGGSAIGADEIANSSKGIEREIDTIMDLALKNALLSYVINSANLIKLKDRRFINLSNEPIVEYYEDVNNNEDTVLPTKEEIVKLEKISEQMYNLPHVQQTGISVDSNLMKRWFVNSEGTKIRTKNFRGGLYWNILIRNNESELQSLKDSFVYTKKSGWNQANIIQKQLKQIEKKINLLYTAKSLESGQYNVILNGSAFGTFMHEGIAAHNLSGEYIAQKIANTFEAKIGKQVMPEFLSISAEPRMKGGYGSFKYDEQGVEAKDTILVEKGILKTFLLDRPSAYDLKLPNNGHSRVEWVVAESEIGTKALSPEPRISNLVIQTHQEVSERDLIRMMLADCEKQGKEFGLYIKSKSGQVDIISGNFELYPDEIWALYTNGKKELLTNAYLLGDPFSLLNSIKACSNNYQTSYGHCGSTDSGWVTTQEIAPSAYFPNVSFQKSITKALSDKLIPGK